MALFSISDSRQTVVANRSNLFSFASPFMTAYAGWRRYRTEKALADLEDWQLKDIGYSPDRFR